MGSQNCSFVSLRSAETLWLVHNVLPIFTICKSFNVLWNFIISLRIICCPVLSVCVRVSEKHARAKRLKVSGDEGNGASGVKKEEKDEWAQLLTEFGGVRRSTRISSQVLTSRSSKPSEPIKSEDNTASSQADAGSDHKSEVTMKIKKRRGGRNRHVIHDASDSDDEEEREEEEEEDEEDEDEDAQEESSEEDEYSPGKVSSMSSST